MRFILLFFIMGLCLVATRLVYRLAADSRTPILIRLGAGFVYFLLFIGWAYFSYWGIIQGNLFALIFTLYIEDNPPN